MKQIGLGMMMYVQDYDERYPINYWHGASPYVGVTQADPSMPGYHFTVSCGNNTCKGNYVTWMDMLYPYIKDINVFYCPSKRQSSIYASYGYNSAFSGWKTVAYNVAWTDKNTALTLSAVARPSEVFLLTEFDGLYSMIDSPVDVTNYANSSTYYTIVAPHLEGGVIAFADGHVKWVPRSRLQINPVVSSNVCDYANPVPATENIYCSRDWNPFIQ
jgi:prepilin-type processing-associated H-X9-DG protein